MFMSADRNAHASIREQADAWWARLRSGRATRADAEALRQWCAQSAEHARAWREVKKAWEALEPAAARAVQADPSAAFPERPRRAAAPAYRPGRRAFVAGAVAASATTFLAFRPPLGLWPSVAELGADYRTGTGEQRQVALSDQVSVQMNTQTRMNLKAGEAGDGIELVAGEAEILAGPQRPFAVYAGAGRLLARSARFNVRHTGPQVCVSCLEGTVDVDLAGQHRVLERGLQLVYDAQGVRAAVAVDPASVSAWRSGALIFTDVPLAEVIDEINRYRPGRVILRNAEMGRRPVQMRFAIHQTDTALTMIRELYGAKLTALPGNIVLMS
jgi:transmembrane sensor